MQERPYYSYHPGRHRRRGSRLLILVTLVVVLFVGIILGLSLLVERTTTDSKMTLEATQQTASKLDPKVIETQQLQTAWQQALIGHQGDVSIAVYDSTTGATAAYATITATFNTASVVKVSILEAILVKNQAKGSNITASQLAAAREMIQNSDNDGATTLWLQAGNSKGMNTFFQQLGATQTTASSTWGQTLTTAKDQLLVLNAFAYPSTVLNATSAKTVVSLLQGVESDQVWGVNAGVPDDVSVELKNGWLPDNQTNDIYSATDTWTITSIGHVHGQG